MPPLGSLAAEAEQEGDEELMRRFEYLSKNGDSDCSRQFMESIPNMATAGLIQGFCCNPMDAHRYVEHVKGIRRYRCIPAIPDDPYNIPCRPRGKAFDAIRFATRSGPAGQMRLRSGKRGRARPLLLPVLAVASLWRPGEAADHGARLLPGPDRRGLELVGRLRRLRRPLSSLGAAPPLNRGAI